MKSALIFVIVSLCIFSQSHAELTPCSALACSGISYVTDPSDTWGTSSGVTVSANIYSKGVDGNENEIIACCVIPCGTPYVWSNNDGAFVDTMPASGTVENNYFYFEDQGICQRILEADIPFLKAALEAEGSNIDSDCAVVDGATFINNQFPYTGGSIHVDLLPSLQTAVSGWSSTDGCSL